MAAISSLENCSLSQGRVVRGHIKVGFLERLIGAAEQANNRYVGDLLSK